jgi:hypothetical protein
VAAVIAFFLSRALRDAQGGFSDLTRANLKTMFRRRRDQTAQESHPGGRIETARRAEDQWGWRYVESFDGQDPYVLASTNSYESEGAALSAASLAYPGLPTRGSPSTGTDGEVRRVEHRSTDHRITMAAGLAIVVALAVNAIRRRL